MKIEEQVMKRIKELQQRYSIMAEEIEKSHLRHLQGDMYRCAANCCDNQSNNIETTRNCINNCNSDATDAQLYVNSLIDRLQNRWTLCMKKCIYAENEKMMSDPSSKSLSEEFNECAVKCVDTHLDLIRMAEASLKKVLENRMCDG